MNEFSNIDLDEKKLADQTLVYILNNQNTILESSFFIRILDRRIKYGDLNNHVEFLKERLSHVEFNVDYDTVEYKNSMSGYQVLALDELGRTFDNSRILSPLLYEMENFSKEVFWASEEEEKIYQSLSHFVSFEDRLVEEKKLYHVLITSPFFNVKGWLSYYQSLLDVKFPDFSEKIISGKNIIKYKPFKDKYFLGIATDYQSCKNNFRKGWWEEPEYKLVIFEKLEKKKINQVVTFERFIHPHFDPPALNFAAFFGSKTMIDVSENETVIDNGTKKEFLEDGMVRLYNSEKFGDELKRHAYFYYDMLYRTTKGYIKFIEESF
ncbi:hypothetical protein [Chryseobacterium shandongense]|uniref:Uncharacterized protein n=1 Tax=Chryseobacterium shandongense TaxID=1493872 RepID=A0ABM7BAE5_9FLAO|nr:hypothetical protein [Chryseobacterium shandongense]AZA95662.1 hypothetical protein EG353_08830 [Chryseobacterium shandongense]